MMQSAYLPGFPDASPRPWEKEHAEVIRQTAAEGMVLLENSGILPLAPATPVALYGSGARHTIKGGTGSGSVNNRSQVSVFEGLQNAGCPVLNVAWLDDFDRRLEEARQAWMESIYAMSEPGDFDSFYHAHASHPLPSPEAPEITKEDCDVAIYVLSRISGEGADRAFAKGDWLLSDVERRELETLSRLYPDLVLVLNTGGMVDLSFLREIRVSALVLMSQGGMEGGNALADLLLGRTGFSGHLTDSWPMRYEDIPSSAHFSHNDGNLIREYYQEDIYVGYRYFDTFQVPVLYPFGYGMTYTSFVQEAAVVRCEGGEARVRVRVTNTGAREGRFVSQLYAVCPEGLRLKENKRLVAFSKTPVLPAGASCDLTLAFPLRLLASYHTGRASWYLDGGVYTLLLGEDAAHTRPVAELALSQTVFLRETGNILPLQDALPLLTPDREAGDAWRRQLREESAGLPHFSLDDEIPAVRQSLEPLPVPAAGKEAEDILSSLTDEEKAALCVGRLKAGPASFIGNAGSTVPGAAGETSPVLSRFGLDNLVLADGPAGLRLQQHFQLTPDTHAALELSPYERLENRFFGKEFNKEGMEDRYQFASAIPIGTLIAQSFDLDLARTLGELIAREMQVFHVHLWLAPGMNIHRNPLCGRNFEYYSEDPVVSGLMAAAITEGVQSLPGCGVTIKHFACNNQEENRRGVSSVVSERALREIYLLGFELAVRLSRPEAIMTSYNKINGVHTANSFDLLERTARGEWGFGGIVMTDWTTTNRLGGASAAKCIQAGNDLTMPGMLSDIEEILQALRRENDQSLDREALDACALRMIACVLRLTRGKPCGI